MGRFFIILKTALIITVCKPLMAQDPQFTQFYANPIYLNPALAGSNYCPRVVMNYRNQWPAITGTFVTTSASYDQYVEGVHGGLAILATNDKAGVGTITTNRVSGIYSYHQKLGRDVSLQAGFEATYHQKSVDWDKLTFGDQIDPRRGFILNTAEQRGTNASLLDVSSGIVVYSKRFYGGFAAHHLTQPNESAYKTQGGNSQLPIKYTAHTGCNIPIGSVNDETSISPNLIYQIQQDFRELNVGFYVNRGPLTGGFWYRGRDAFIMLVGVQYNMFKFGYSYDVTVSKLANATAGSHEISFTTQFACKPTKRKFRPIDCPSF